MPNRSLSPFFSVHVVTPLQRLRWAVLPLAIALGACATVSSAPPEDTVRQRGNERWKALVAADFGKAYSYNTPSFRSVVSQEVYRGRIGGAVVWVGAELVEVKCPEAAKCLAKVRIDFKPVMRGAQGDKLSTYGDETWLLEDGQWWIFESLS